MPIRPIDLQVAIPKMSEIARIKHLEQQKPGLQQQQNATTTDKSVGREHHTVMQKKKDSKADTEADAKKKGSNSYTGQRHSRKKGEDQEKEERNQTHNIIDIRI